MLLDLGNLVLQLLDFVSELLVRHLQVLHLLIVLISALLCLQCLAHAERDGGFVEALVSTNRHPNLVADAKKQQPSFSTDDGYLPDQLVEALRVQLLSNRANSRLARLALLQPFVEILLQVHHICARGRCAGHILYPQLIFLRPLPRRKDGVENVLGLRHGRLGIFLLFLVFLALCSTCGADENGRIVLHQRRLHRGLQII
mmetsp:Transcript_134805/g.319539  ORF Transcript_134805/g.319539 Transcript_134805/m.319539 type:complete len:201 (-) Transcript_134805:21-623(-)